MRILLLTHSFNSLTQRLFSELTAAGHELSIEFDINDRVTEEAVALWQPALVIAPFLKRRIPDTVWQRVRCIVIHPGIAGDRGPSALDWAIMTGETRWGVTAIEANGELDGGPVWASIGFPMREATKSSLYRNEVTEAAVQAVALTLQRIADGEPPQPADRACTEGRRGQARAPMRQSDRAIDWARDDTATVMRRMRAADGAPGVFDRVRGLDVTLYDAHVEGQLSGRGRKPGELIAQRDGAILRATRDGAIWITHLKLSGDTDGLPALKRPAAQVLGPRIADVLQAPLPPDAIADYPTWRPIRYEERDAVGWLHFPFYNGTMSTASCEALTAAVRAARARPTRVLVLAGGPDFWSNGIDLNQIEAHPHPAEESWRNINAIDDLVLEILSTDHQLTIAAMAGNAGAGGVFAALAADKVFARAGVVLNPHYKSMGNLYGSEYWTYLLPRRVAADSARTLMASRLPVSAPQAAALGLIDAAFGASIAEFHCEVDSRALAIANDMGFRRHLAQKNNRRADDALRKPLAAYRAEELERMKLNFFGFDPSYHVARQHFVAKRLPARTPLWLARHRAQRPQMVQPRVDALA